MEKEIIKIAGVEFFVDDLKELEKKYFEENKKYIVKYKTIYKLVYNEAKQDKFNKGYFGAVEIYKNKNKKDLGYTRRGRFIITTAKQVNELIGRKFLLED